MVGTQRLNLGVVLNSAYKPVKLTSLPPVLAALGRRVLEACKQLEWPFACSDIDATPAFDQAYIQRYKPSETPHEPGQVVVRSRTHTHTRSLTFVHAVAHAPTTEQAWKYV